MQVNEVVVNGVKELSLVNDTVSENTLLENVTAHDASGKQIVGKVVVVPVDSELDAESENAIQNKAVAEALQNVDADALDGYQVTSMIVPYGYCINSDGSHKDLNELNYPSSWLAFKDSPNTPPNATGWGTVLVYTGGTGSIVQLWVDYNGILSFIRSFDGNNWSEWKNVADGGNAATVNGFTVQTAVPANAKFTDTTYGAASATANGLMSTDAQTFAGAKTFNGIVKVTGATDASVSQVRNIAAGTDEATTSNCPNGALYGQYT